MSVSSAASGISDASCLTRASTMNNSEMIPNAWIHAGKRSTVPPILQDEATPTVPTDGMVSVLFAGKTRKGVTPSNPEKPNQGNHLPILSLPILSIPILTIPILSYALNFLSYTHPLNILYSTYPLTDPMYH